MHETPGHQCADWSTVLALSRLSSAGEVTDDLTVLVDEGERQMLLLALAILALDRPGWRDALERLAEKYRGRGLFDTFIAVNADRWQARPPAPL